jgi:hypothetical protein
MINIRSDRYWAADETDTVIGHLDDHVQMWGSNTSASSVFTSHLGRILAKHECLLFAYH